MKQVKEFPRAERARWDWEKILDGKVHLLEPGVDFDESRDWNTVRGGLISTARRSHGHRLRTSVTKDGIIVQSLGREEAA